MEAKIKLTWVKLATPKDVGGQTATIKVVQENIATDVDGNEVVLERLEKDVPGTSATFKAQVQALKNDAVAKHNVTTADFDRQIAELDAIK